MQVLVMFQLFELVRLLTVKDECDTGRSPSIVRYAWKEAGEINLLALACTNGFLILRYCCSGREPQLRQLPWPPDKPISSMCFDPTVAWLLIITEDCTLFIIPALAIMDPKARVNQLWKIDDVTITKVKRPKGVPTVVYWWHTMDDQQIAIIGTKNGEVLFVDLLRRKKVNELTVDTKIMQFDLVEDDQQMSTSLLITGQSGLQWKLFLESRTSDLQPVVDKELSDLGYDQIDNRQMPVISIISPTELTKQYFIPLRFYQFQRSVSLMPQYAKGRHFIAAHCDKNSTYQVFDSNIEHLPLFVYKLPFGAYNVILTDKIIFTTTRLAGQKKLLLIANQRAETSLDAEQEFNKDSILQEFNLPQEERLQIVLRKSYPFYWHEKREEDFKMKYMQDDQIRLSPDGAGKESLLKSHDIHVTSHTVLNGCIIITDSTVYECRPRISPERLFLEIAMQQSDITQTENLGIGLGLDCSHTRKVAAFARHGCVLEVLNYLRQILGSQGSDITAIERKQLTDMAVHCFVQQIQQDNEFLVTNFYYEEKATLQLLAENGFIYILIELAKARGLVMEALELLANLGCYRIDKELIDGLISKGFTSHLVQAAKGVFLQNLKPEEFVNFLCDKIQLALQNCDMIKNCLDELCDETLMRVAETFDPSTPFLRAFFSRQMSSRKRTASISSINSLSSDGDHNVMDGNLPDVGKILKIFLLVILTLNTKRDHSGHQVNLDSLLITDSRQVTKIDTVTNSHSQEKKPVEKRRRIPCRPQPIGCGHQHVAMVRNGDVYTWGKTSNGRLGHGDLAPENTISPPCRVETLHMLQVKVISVTCGGEHTVALTQHGLFAWGSSLYGQVGIGTRHIYSRPMLIDSLSTVPCVSVDCGQYHTIALTVDGEVYTWGWGVHGQLGHGNPDDLLIPTKVKALSDDTITQISAGYCHTLVLNTQGEVYAFGCGFFGQMGLGSNQKQTLPVKVYTIPEKVTTVATKYFHSVAVTISNRIYIWGSHPYNLRFAAHALRKARQAGQTLGDPVEPYLTPELVDTSYVNGKILQVVTGSSHTAVITSDGDVYMWGRNLEGQLGNNTRQDLKIPSMVTSINDRQITHMCSGGEYNIALDSDGLVWVWGKNDTGQLGLEKENQLRISKNSGRRRAGSVVSEVVVPTVCKELPSVKPSSSWRSSLSRSMSSDSGEPDNTWWTEDGTDNRQLDLLPDLQSVGDVKYSRVVILHVLEHLSDMCNCVQLLRKCIDIEDWLSASYICQHQTDYPQALAFHLKALTKYKANYEDQFTQATIKAVKHYLGLCIQQELSAAQKEENYRVTFIQVFYHWDHHRLPVPELEMILEDYMDNICCVISLFLFWDGENKELERKPETDEETRDSNVYIGSNRGFKKQFSTKFCLCVLQKVLEKMASLDFEKKHPICFNAFKSLSKDSFDYGTLDLQPSDRMIPFEQLWQDVVQNLQKGSETKNYIYITRSELDHLDEQLHEQNSTPVNKFSAEESLQEPNTVLFTCGHFYTKKSFFDEVLVKFNRELSLGSSSLPESASLLTQYYSRQGLLPLACPKCVLNALHATM
ncbi:hypothetical protein KUTeg_020885 [Tegillarca granosa]|uniref:RCC1-like domain-containing protein n=1 Tax=Tegillarca granosa TaxID=220873 RepID=A0ABQ9E977_TEGGR|nr:hypothetical protein KUTeg_020885 [Tegillarca granosa]